MAINGNTTGKIEASWWQGGLFLAPATREQADALEVLRRDLKLVGVVEEIHAGPAASVQTGDKQPVA